VNDLKCKVKGIEALRYIFLRIREKYKGVTLTTKNS
jgi:hypothetical protein